MNNDQVFNVELNQAPATAPAPEQPLQPTAPSLKPPVPIPELPKEKNNFSVLNVVLMIFVSLLLVTFIGLFTWAFINYNDVKTDVDAQIDYAVKDAVAKREDELEEEFAEREKNPYATFSGPDDYGGLSFKYPKTWSVYINSDITKGGDFEAYLNPGEVNKVSKDTINALRVSILNKSYDDVIADYQKKVSSRNSNLKSQSITVNKTLATEYSGTIPNTDLNGYIVVFKIRDKTVVLQTDSVLFEADFDRILSTVNFNS